VLDRAQHLVEQIEDEAARVAKSALARTLEFAEDIWAEAQGARKDSSAH
jgi:hypothetical protein